MSRDIIKKYKKKVKLPTYRGQLNIKAVSRSKIIQTLWDNSLSVGENAQRITSEQINDYLPETYTELPPPKLPEPEAEICERLEARYGNDFKKMARDIKLNRWQWNELECAKRFAKWKNH